MPESSAAEILPVPMIVNGQTFYWCPLTGLDLAVVAQVEGWIQRRAEGYLHAATMRGLERDDLLQEGRAGALKAAQDYDPAFGVGYLSYADHWIRQAMRAALGRSHDVYLQKRARAQALKDNDLPTVLRLDAHTSESDSTLGDLIPASEPGPLDQAQQAERTAHLWHALNRLNPRHRAVLIHRYGLQGTEESLATVGLRLGCTREPVRRLQLQAETKLRALLLETAMPKATPKPAPYQPNQQPGTQMTLQSAIRDRERHEAARRKAEQQQARADRKTRKEAVKGPQLPGLLPDPEVPHV